MKEMSNPNTCERVDDLIGFLYDELSEMDARRFEGHLRECAACEAEFTAFGQIRESMLEWRNESLGLARLPAVSVDTGLAPTAAQPGMPARSALAALREFFALSPLWMKGATAFATLLFCVCAVLAVGYMKGRQSATVSNDKVYSKAEFEARLAIELQKLHSAAPSSDKPTDNIAAVPPNHRNVVKSPVVSRVPENAGVRNLRRPFTQQERQELATDLRLVSSKDDDDPDLTIDSNRPTP